MSSHFDRIPDRNGRRIAISISRVSVLTRDKNQEVCFEFAIILCIAERQQWHILSKAECDKHCKFRVFATHLFRKYFNEIAA